MDVMLPMDLPLSPSQITLGLGDAFQYAFNDSLDINLPSEIVQQLNNKIHLTRDNELVFDHEGFYGKLGMLKGEMRWNDGENLATYNNFVSDNWLTVNHHYRINGEFGSLERELFGNETLKTYSAEGSYFWNIEPENLKATFQSLEIMNFEGPHGNLSSDKDMSLEFEGKFNEDNADMLSVVVTPSLKMTVNDDEAGIASEDLIDYTGTITFTIPSKTNCENYFSPDFNEKSECEININSSDIPMPIVIKMKHKFALVRAEELMLYVRSENRQGQMVGFDENMYLSWYFDENVQGQSFDAIKEKGNYLILTIPLGNAFDSEIIPAALDYTAKWDTFLDNLEEDVPKSIIKAVYWMDKWAHTAKDSTFDISEIAAATRIGSDLGELTNESIQYFLQYTAEELAYALQYHEFLHLKALRDDVDEIVSYRRAAKRFALPT